MYKKLGRYFPVFLLPLLVAFLISFLIPFLLGLYLSFCRFTTVSDAVFIGLQNYREVFHGTYLHSLWYTALFSLCSVITVNLLGFLLALLLTRGLRGTNLFRTVFFTPNLIGGIVLGYIWSTLIDGVLIRFGTALALNTKAGFWGLIILLSWQQIGYMMIIYIAGLQAVPEDMLEAARIDGATRWQTLWKITIPNVMPSFTICTFLSLTNGFKLYDQNLALTNGLPLIQNPDGSVIKTTEMLALNIVNSYTSNATNRGPGQAKAVVFFVLVAIISLVQLRATRKREVQQ